MASPVARLFATLLIERPSRRQGAAAQLDALEVSASALPERFRAAAGHAKAADVLRHVVAIERWGQRRLRVALGELAFERDESHAYKPPADTPYERLIEDLVTTRSETLRLGRRVVQEGKSDTLVEHNAMGPISARGWLRYLQQHGDLEARRVRVGKARRG